MNGIQGTTHPYWNQISGSVEIAGSGADAILMHLMNRKAESEECLTHRMEAALFDHSQRPYRRGKNRCSRCGMRKD